MERQSSFKDQFRREVLDLKAAIIDAVEKGHAKELEKHLKKWNSSAVQTSLWSLGRQEGLEHYIDQDGDMLAHIAAKKNYADVMLVLRNNDRPINRTNRDGDTPGHIAARNGYADVVEMLMSNSMLKIGFFGSGGIDPIDEDSNGNRMAHLAARNGHVAVLKILDKSDYAGIFDRPNKHSDTPLSLAVQNGHLEAARYLLKRVCFWKTSGPLWDKNNDGDLPVHIAARNGEAEIIKFFLDERLTKLFSDSNSQGDLPVHIAAKEGHLNVIEVLHEAGLSLSIMNSEGDMPIDIARKQGNMALIDYIRSAEDKRLYKNATLRLHPS